MPSAKLPTDQDHNPFDFRSGLGNIPLWTGMVLQGSTAYPSSHQFRYLENIRFFQHGLRERGGQTQISGAMGTLRGIFEATDLGMTHVIWTPALSAGLVSYWRLEEESGTRSDSHGANHLTDHNTATSGSGKIGVAGQFDAPTLEAVYIADADQSGLNPGLGDFSYSLWMYPTSLSAPFFYSPLGKGAALGGATHTEGYWFTLYGTGLPLPVGTLAFNFGDSVQTVRAGLGTSFVAPVNTWTHVVATHDRDGLLTAWVNGFIAGTVSIASHNADCSPSAAFSLGSISFNTPPYLGGQHFTGRVDEVAFWSRLLTPDEVGQLYNGGQGLTYA